MPLPKIFRPPNASPIIIKRQGEDKLLLQLNVFLAGDPNPPTPLTFKETHLEIFFFKTVQLSRYEIV